MGSGAMDRSVGFLSTQPAGKREKRGILAAFVLSAVMFCLAAPAARLPLTPIFGFIPVYDAALVIGDLITAALLLSQVSFLRSPALLTLACGYLFTACMATAHALTFPGLFSPTGWLGAGPQTTAWLYMFWHGGFPLFVVAYAFLKSRRLTRTGLDSRFPWGATLTVGAVLAAAAGMILLVTAGHALLPAIMQGNGYTPVMLAVVISTWALSLVAVAVLWLRKPHTFLDLCLIVVMCA